MDIDKTVKKQHFQNHTHNKIGFHLLYLDICLLLFHFSYQRYLVNQIRKEFGLEGTPVRIIVREKGEKE